MKTRILVDGNCIVCDWEMKHYEKIRPDLFERVDISDPVFRPETLHLTSEEVQQELHVILKSGEVRKGVDAFLVIWDQIPQYRWLTKVVSLPGIYTYAKFCYWIFANWVRPILPKKNRYLR